jgi:uncharacterized membrane protein YjfL (UPF0719 family)
MAEAYKLNSDSFTEFLNPFRNVTTINNIFDVINLLAVVLTSISSLIAVLYIVYGGYQYITSAGNPEASKTAVSTITWSVIGLVIILLAYIIVEFVITYLQTAQA